MLKLTRHTSVPSPRDCSRNSNERGPAASAVHPWQCAAHRRRGGPKEQARELGTGVSRIDTLESLGLKSGRLGEINLAPRLRIEDGIQAVRSLLPKCWFDADRCAKGVEALKLYRSDYDEKHGVMRPRPIHDWTSHCADSFRMAATGADFVGAGARIAGFNRRIEMPLMTVA